MRSARALQALDQFIHLARIGRAVKSRRVFWSNYLKSSVQFSSVSSRSPHAHSTTVSTDGSAP